MLPRANRFSFRKGYPKNTVHNLIFILRYQKNETFLHAAVVVGKKIDARATVRNRVKRQFLEALQKEIPKEFSYDLVFLIKKDILNKNSDTIRQEIIDTIKKLS